MNEREGDGAKAFDFYHDMFVLADAAGIPFIPGEWTSGDADAVAYLEFLFLIYFATHGVFGCEQAEETKFCLPYRLNVGS